MLTEKPILQIRCQHAINIIKVTSRAVLIEYLALCQSIHTKSSSILSIPDTMSRSQISQIRSSTFLFLKYLHLSPCNATAPNHPRQTLTSNRSTLKTPTCQPLNQPLLRSRPLHPQCQTPKNLLLLQPRRLPTTKQQNTNAPAAHPTRLRTGSGATAAPAP